MSEQEIFQRESRPFKLNGTDYVYKFLPAIHFTGVFRQGIEIYLSMQRVGVDTVVTDIKSISDNIKSLCEDRVYDILRDVLQYQNSTTMAINKLKYETPPLEIIAFLDLVLTDSELVRGMEDLVKTVGKLTEGMNGAALLQTPNSTPSS